MKIQDIKISTVDTERLIKFLAITLGDNQKLHVDKFGIVNNHFEVDPDCVFCELRELHINNKVTTAIEISCRIKKYDEDGSYTIRTDKPDFTKSISLEDYLQIANEMPLTEFLRYNYNPRIQSNQRLLMAYIREHEPQKQN